MSPPSNFQKLLKIIAPLQARTMPYRLISDAETPFPAHAGFLFTVPLAQEGIFFQLSRNTLPLEKEIEKKAALVGRFDGSGKPCFGPDILASSYTFTPSLASLSVNFSKSSDGAADSSQKPVSYLHVIRLKENEHVISLPPDVPELNDAKTQSNLLKQIVTSGIKRENYVQIIEIDAKGTPTGVVHVPPSSAEGDWRKTTCSLEELEKLLASYKSKGESTAAALTGSEASVIIDKKPVLWKNWVKNAKKSDAATIR
jgi:hypothetical protein